MPISTIPAANTTMCVICRATIPAEGKHIHMCIVRAGRKVISREHIGFFDGTPICYRAFDAHSGLEVEAELDRYVSDLAQQTACDTQDMLADRAAETSTEAPGECDAYGCHDAVTHIVQTGPDAAYSTYHVCCYHYRVDITGEPCDCAAIAKTAACSPAHPCDNPNHNHSAIYAAPVLTALSTPPQPNIFEMYCRAYGWARVALEEQRCPSCGDVAIAGMCAACVETGETMEQVAADHVYAVAA